MLRPCKTMAKRKSAIWDEKGDDVTQCPKCLKLYKELPKDGHSQATGLAPDCDCLVETAGRSNVSKRNKK